MGLKNRLTHFSCTNFVKPMPTSTFWNRTRICYIVCSFTIVFYILWSCCYPGSRSHLPQCLNNHNVLGLFCWIIRLNEKTGKCSNFQESPWYSKAIPFIIILLILSSWKVSFVNWNSRGHRKMKTHTRFKVAVCCVLEIIRDFLTKEDFDINYLSSFH